MVVLVLVLLVGRGVWHDGSSLKVGEDCNPDIVVRTSGKVA
jgi:hypothetical protein